MDMATSSQCPCCLDVESSSVLATSSKVSHGFRSELTGMEALKTRQNAWSSQARLTLFPIGDQTHHSICGEPCKMPLVAVHFETWLFPLDINTKSICRETACALSRRETDATETFPNQYLHVLKKTSDDRSQTVAYLSRLQCPSPIPYPP